MQWINGNVQEITDMGDRWKFIIGYDNDPVYATKDRFGVFKWTFPKVGMYVSALIDENGWAKDWGVEK